MLIKSIQGKKPSWGKNIFIAENATLVGDVILGDDCSLWYNAVVRGDVHQIRIGNAVNIQDGAIIHATRNRYPVSIGNNVSIGHRAIIHGCTIENDVLVGMGSIIMDNCLIKSHSIIAAGAVVTENTIVESGCIYAGIPARKVKEISEQQRERITEIAKHYIEYSVWARETDNELYFNDFII